MQNNENRGVATQHKDYSYYWREWQKCRDVFSGQRAVHAAGELYLPRLADQTDKEYNAYVMRASFYNASWRTVAGLCGMLFRKAPTQDLPPLLAEYANDITLENVELEAFSKEVAYEVLETGRVGILVDFPENPYADQMNAADAATLKLRPYMRIYATENILNWKYRLINNVRVPCLIVLTENAVLDDGEYQEFYEKTETHYRVLSLDDNGYYHIRIFTKDNQNNDVLLSDIVPQMNGAPLTYIPFVCIGIDSVKLDCEEPPLIDLVDVNLSHYRTNADYEHACHFTALPTPWAAGFEPPADDNGRPQPLRIGSSSAWIARDPSAKCAYLEFTGQGLGALTANLDRKERQMAVLGARMLADDKAGVEAYKTIATKQVTETSILASIAISISKGIRIALQWVADWAGVAGEIKYEINREFLPVAIDAQTLAQYMAMWQGGGISEGEFYDLLQRADLIESEKTLEEHQLEIDKETPPIPPNTIAPTESITLK